MRRKFKFELANLIAAMFLTFFTANVHAQAHNWIGGSGDFDVVWNWDIGVPDQTDVARFDLASSATIQLNATQNIRLLEKMGSTILFSGGNRLHTQAESEVSEGRMFVLGTGTEFHNDTNLKIGGTGTLAEILVQSGGLVDTVGTQVANPGGQSGSIDVRGAGSTWNNSGTLMIGNSGNGSLNIQGSGVVTCNDSYIAASPASTSSANLSDSGSRWDVAEFLNVGNLGDGSLEIEDGAVVTCGRGYIGKLNGSTGNVTMSGDQTEWSMDRLFLGTPDGLANGGVGTLNINRIPNSTDDTAVWVGDHRSATAASNFLSVSDSSANGRAYILNGSTINAGGLYLGEGLNNVGEIFISGEGSRLALQLSINCGFGAGCGKLTVAEGGSFAAPSNGRLGNGVVVVQDNGSQLEFGNLYLGSSDGNNDLGVASLNVEALQGSNESAIVYVGDYRSSDQGDGSIIFVADSGSRGNLVVRNGSTLTVDYTHVGTASGTSGEATVTGSTSEFATRWNSFIGSDGSGTLNILDGGHFFSKAVRIANASGSVGEVNVVGSGSTLANNGPLHVGFQGTATLNIDQGGVVLALNSININSLSNVNIGTGQLGSSATSSITNDGTIGFTGIGVVQGPVNNGPSGQIRVQPNAQATFLDAVEHNGSGIETQANGKLIFSGGYRGDGPLFGDGDVFFEGELEPGDGIGSIEFQNSVVLEDSATMMIELGGTAGNQFDKIEIDGDCDIAGDLQIDFVSGHELSLGNKYLILTIGGNATGQFDGLSEGTVVTNSNGYLLRISYLAGDGNDIELYVTSIPQEITPDVLTVTRGNHVAGLAADLGVSDNFDVSIQRNITDIQSRTEFEVEATSPYANPSTMELKLEGAVFARSQVIQTIELFNYQTNIWEPVDSREATRFTDSTATVIPTGDLSRFVEPGGNSIAARIRYRSTNPRQQFSSNTDQLLWMIGE